MTARLKSISISGFKSLGEVTLPLDGLSVLIGDNGSGKSSILEALEILRCTTHEGFVNRMASAHGGVHQLLEHGATEIQILSIIDDGEPAPLTYLQRWMAHPFAFFEMVARSGSQRTDVLIDRMNGQVQVQGVDTTFTLSTTESLVFASPSTHSAVATVREALQGIEVHLPFQVTAHWAASERDRRSARGISIIEPTSKLERFGTNLVNAYQSLKNDFGIDHWKDTLEYVQLGLGTEIRDIRLEAIPGGGHIALAVETVHQGRIPAFSLADGVLSFLAFVALFRLDAGRTVLAFDEPELHLHPGLLMRVLGMLETMSDHYPVVIATHSDRLLDGLSDPANAVVVTELDERSRTRLRRLDPKALAQWIRDYRGLGELRADGELPSVLADEPIVASPSIKPPPSST